MNNRITIPNKTLVDIGCTRTIEGYRHIVLTFNNKNPSAITKLIRKLQEIKHENTKL